MSHAQQDHEEYQYESEADWRQEPEYESDTDWRQEPEYESKAKKERQRIAKAYATMRLRDGEIDGNYGPFQAAMMAARAECDTKHEPFSAEWLAELEEHPTFHQWQSWCWDPCQTAW
jgi:hypothetical protein